MIEYLEFEELPNDSKAAKQFLYTIEQYYLDPEGILCHIWVPEGKRSSTPKSQLVVPASLRHEILVNVHDLPTGGHLGVKNLCQASRALFLAQDVHGCSTLVFEL